jgi:CheY-like chemotaxis protein
VNQTLTVRLLEKQGHAVQVVGDGQAALQALSQYPFDLVLMDVQMPVMDGLEATAAIRQEEKCSGGHIPIIAMFLEDYPKSVEELQEAITAGDAQRTERLAHSLKGAVSSFGAHGAYNLAHDLECRGHQGELGNASSILRQLVHELERIAIFATEHQWPA